MSSADKGKPNDTSVRNQSPESFSRLSVHGNGIAPRIMDQELTGYDVAYQVSGQDLYSRLRSQEEEILLLHKQIDAACTKELEMLNETHVLGRKLSDLRVALHEKHNSALTDALKDLEDKKAYMEYNLRMADELKVMENEKYIFTSSLLGLLAEYGIRPSVTDASSISSNTKRLYNEMHRRIHASHASTSFNSQSSRYPPDMHVESPSNQSRYGGDRDMPEAKDVNTPASTEFQFPPNNGRSRDVEGQPTVDQLGAAYDSEGELLPGINGFFISGDARPGNLIIACGYPINGTSLCMFQWVRHLQDGTRQYVEGASTPEYFVTADDVDKILAVECVPMDDSGRQGELVRYFANNQNKISCDPEMQQEIQKYVSAGHARFNVLVLRDSPDSWKPATIILKRASYQVKIDHTDMLLIEEKYSSDLSIKIPFAISTQFLLVCSGGLSYPFSTSGTPGAVTTDNDFRLRDLIVLAVRIFQTKALNDRRKGKV